MGSKYKSVHIKNETNSLSAVISRKAKRRLWFDAAVGVLALLVVLILSVPIVSWHVASVGAKSVRTLENTESGDAIIVLGAYVSPNGIVSDMLRDRLDFAALLYKQGSAPKIIVSGDHGQKEYDEVNAMRNYLLEQDIPSEDIFMDHAGFNTYSSMYRARDVFCVTKPIVVSQNYHVTRAIYIGKKLGLDASGVGSDTHRYVGMNGYELREHFARYKAFLSCMFKMKPKFLGEQIPVSGSGEATVD